MRSESFEHIEIEILTKSPTTQRTWQLEYYHIISLSSKFELLSEWFIKNIQFKWWTQKNFCYNKEWKINGAFCSDRLFNHNFNPSSLLLLLYYTRIKFFSWRAVSWHNVNPNDRNSVQRSWFAINKKWRMSHSSRVYFFSIS